MCLLQSLKRFPAPFAIGLDLEAPRGAVMGSSQPAYCSHNKSGAAEILKGLSAEAVPIVRKSFLAEHGKWPRTLEERAGQLAVHELVGVN